MPAHAEPARPGRQGDCAGDAAAPEVAQVSRLPGGRGGGRSNMERLFGRPTYRAAAGEATGFNEVLTDPSMLTESDILPTGQLHAPAAIEKRTDRSRPTTARRVGRWLARLACLGLVAGLAAFNAWWYWRESRPPVDGRTIQDWIASGRYDRAEAALRERLRRAPHEVEARMTLARVLAARGDMIGCARELDRIPYWSPRRPEALFRAAQAYLAADRARDAESSLRALLDDDPLHPPDPGLYHDASQELLKILAAEDRWDDAYPIIWKAFDHAAPADRPLVLTMRIRSELERVAPAETIKVLRKYLAADPSDFEALRAMARAKLALGRHAEAVRDIESCLRARPDDPRAWRDYLSMLQSLGEQEAFDANLARVPRSAESEAEIWTFRAQASERAGDLNGAARNYREALSRNPNLSNAHYSLAIIEERLGHRQEAAAHRKRWQELRDARTRLPQAGRDYQAALAAASAPDAPPAALAKLRTASFRIAAIWADLGVDRAAEAFNQVGSSL